MIDIKKLAERTEQARKEIVEVAKRFNTDTGLTIELSLTVDGSEANGITFYRCKSNILNSKDNSMNLERV